MHQPKSFTVFKVTWKLQFKQATFNRRLQGLSDGWYCWYGYKIPLNCTIWSIPVSNRGKRRNWNDFAKVSTIGPEAAANVNMRNSQSNQWWCITQALYAIWKPGVFRFMEFTLELKALGEQATVGSSFELTIADVEWMSTRLQLTTQPGSIDNSTTITLREDGRYYVSRAWSVSESIS